MSAVDLNERLQEQSDLSSDVLRPAFGSRYMQVPVPKYSLPDDEMPSNIAYQLIHDELDTEVHPIQNLASFVTTWMEPEAERLMQQNLNKNLVDVDQYPMVHQINDRCIAIVADILNCSPDAFGSSTLGSSEACFLAGLAMKCRWTERMKSREGPDMSHCPNLIMSKSAHLIWEKFCTYFDVERRVVDPIQDDVVVDPDSYGALIDEGTIGAVLIMGSTLTGQYEPIQQIAERISHVARSKDLDIPIHIDAAIGGFIAPFIDPDLVWDFRLSQVHSINLSGHKYGLVYPGIGFIIFRNSSYCPSQLRFRLDYLGAKSQEDMCINFSRSAAPTIAQYYNFIRLGRNGYRRIMATIRSNAVDLCDKLVNASKGEFRSINDPSNNLPVVVLTPTDGSRIAPTDLSMRLRHRGWTVPTYSIPYGDKHIEAIRIVVRESLSRDQTEILVKAFVEALDEIQELDARMTKSDIPGKRGRPHLKLSSPIC